MTFVEPTPIAGTFQIKEIPFERQVLDQMRMGKQLKNWSKSNLHA